jgi:hypothetical protein
VQTVPKTKKPDEHAKQKTRYTGEQHPYPGIHPCMELEEAGSEGADPEKGSVPERKLAGITPKNIPGHSQVAEK